MPYKVVIADDEPIMRKAMQTLIDWESLDCELVYVASSGQEVEQILLKEMPDILISDIQMPGKNGLDIAKYVWEQKLLTKVILLTAFADFSYAQAAIKYNVVDYIVKTGAFEGLVLAIEKAKEQLKKAENVPNEENLEILMENFFRKVFDGTLYERAELIAKADKTGICLPNKWMIVALRFRVNEDKKRDYVHQSLKNFLRMVFESQMLHGIAIKKNMLVVLLQIGEEERYEDIKEKCLQVVEMMDNFMKMHVYIGLSRVGSDIQELKPMYEEAEIALKEGYFYEWNKINYYQEQQNENCEYRNAISANKKELRLAIRKGQTQEALEQFQAIADYFKEYKVSTDAVFELGTEIESWCKTILSEFDKTLGDVVSYKTGVTQLIYQCGHLDEYVELIKNIIEHTTEYISVFVDKKNALIYEVENYIEENYEKNISVSEVARSVGVSLSYLSRVFKEGTGDTLIHFINTKKLEKAKEYLDSTDMKVYEIADELGFENTTYFSRFFKKHTGVAPKDYKEQSEGNR